MSYLNENRIVTYAKLEKALNLGNLDGIKRLASFVGSRQVYPQMVFSACERQRREFEPVRIAMNQVKVNDKRV